MWSAGGHQGRPGLLHSHTEGFVLPFWRGFFDATFCEAWLIASFLGKYQEQTRGLRLCCEWVITLSWHYTWTTPCCGQQGEFIVCGHWKIYAFFPPILFHRSLERKKLTSILYWGITLEEGMVTHSSILAWKILWTEESDRLQSIGSQRVGHNRNNWIQSRWTMLWQFQADSKGTQPYLCIYPFSPKLPSHPGCHRALSRAPSASQEVLAGDPF